MRTHIHEKLRIYVHSFASEFQIISCCISEAGQVKKNAVMHINVRGVAPRSVMFSKDGPAIASSTPPLGIGCRKGKGFQRGGSGWFQGGSEWPADEPGRLEFQGIRQENWKLVLCTSFDGSICAAGFMRKIKPLRRKLCRNISFMAHLMNNGKGLAQGM